MKAVKVAVFAVFGFAVACAVAAPRLAFQVYAVRDLCERDFVGTLKAAKAGRSACVMKPEYLAEIERFRLVDDDFIERGRHGRIPGRRNAHRLCERRDAKHVGYR